MDGHTVRDSLYSIIRATDDVPRYARRIQRGRLSYTASERKQILAYARNVAALLNHATDAHREEGATWYHVTAMELWPIAAPFGLWRTATALASTSPGMPWHRNVDAVRAVREAAMGGNIRATVKRYALPVPYGWRPYLAALDALTTGRDVLAGPKVRAFRAGVASHGMTYHVCVDGHATLAAAHGPVSVRPGITGANTPGARLYDALAAAYATVAHDRGVWPTAVQATAWLVWRDIATVGR